MVILRYMINRRLCILPPASATLILSVFYSRLQLMSIAALTVASLHCTSRQRMPTASFSSCSSIIQTSI
ncbi:hypothetical protein BDV38DRAFT_261191 [Aspergillus pseudotamarii]|uniref:Uncharacterized protein n=1 Tax=Aspergillus pseudotamarii TaxID=132259 RepID=A0A5N6SF04_ASPPS|nr:uncharacterized protein BDV38DRAFT_261191 [Aspergillus pseudotamarii]KAE8132439.1 hypothetical protein BDV38DRAFT_261191 [Aspergillus pseudotamarii]